MITEAEYTLGPNIWFVLHFKDGVLDALEEHDWREGGFITKPSNLTWEDFAVKRVRNRVTGDDYKARAEQDIRQLIKTGGTYVD